MINLNFGKLTWTMNRSDEFDLDFGKLAMTFVHPWHEAAEKYAHSSKEDGPIFYLHDEFIQVFRVWRFEILRIKRHKRHE